MSWFERILFSPLNAVEAAVRTADAAMGMGKNTVEEDVTHILSAFLDTH